MILNRWAVALFCNNIASNADYSDTNVSIHQVKIFFAAATAGCGIILSILNLIEGNWISSISILFCGLLVGSGWLFGFVKNLTNPLWQAFALVAGCIGILAILFGHRAFDSDRTQAHADIYSIFVYMDRASCQTWSSELEALRLEGIRACSIQSTLDLMDATTELQKATSLGPTLSIIDGVRAAARKPNADWCVEAYFATEVLCPLPFTRLPKGTITK